MRKPNYPVINGMKICSKCEEEKVVQAFHEASAIRKDGTVAYRPECKKCRAIDNREYNKRRKAKKEGK